MNKIRWTGIALLLALGCAGIARAQKPDVKGSKDYPLLSQMPNFYIYEYAEQEFDGEKVYVNDKDTQVEGRKYAIRYVLNEGFPEPSRLQVMRNYENAVKQLGGVITYHRDDRFHARVDRQGKRVWILLNAYHPENYYLTIVEEQGMRQDVRTGAAEWLADIGSTGHAAVYGIYFDTGKADLKPESEPAIAEMAKLMKQDPKLKLWVVGHTDNVGQHQMNMDLSRKRAAAVVTVLTGKRGVTPDRLRPEGLGPLAPVASNDAEEGRAKNRRVELVKQ